MRRISDTMSEPDYPSEEVPASVEHVVVVRDLGYTAPAPDGFEVPEGTEFQTHGVSLFEELEEDRERDVSLEYDAGDELPFTQKTLHALQNTRKTLAGLDGDGKDGEIVFGGEAYSADGEHYDGEVLEAVEAWKNGETFRAPEHAE